MKLKPDDQFNDLLSCTELLPGTVVTVLENILILTRAKVRSSKYETVSMK